MDKMSGVMFGLAKHLRKETLVDLVEKALEQYRKSPTEESFDVLGSYCSLLVVHHLTGHRSMDSIQAEMDKLSAMRESLKNQNADGQP